MNQDGYPLKRRHQRERLRVLCCREVLGTGQQALQVFGRMLPPEPSIGTAFSCSLPPWSCSVLSSPGRTSETLERASVLWRHNSGVLVTHREFDAFPTAYLRAFHHPEARHWLPPGPAPAFCLRVACFGPSYECSSNYAGFVCSCAWLLSLASVLDVVLLPDI